MTDCELRPLKDSDRGEYAIMLHTSFNIWYWKKGWGSDYFKCRPEETAIFHDIYNDITPSCSVAAFDRKTDLMMGACFYHPREYHVSLGIMSVHPGFWGSGVGKTIVNYIIDFARQKGYKSVRLVGSAINMDSFSLYNRSGFVPRKTYHDMVISVPAGGITGAVPGIERVRDAKITDAHAMGDIEFEVSGIKRLQDYIYTIENKRGLFEVKVLEGSDGKLDGFMVSLRHPALNMIGPGVARTEEGAAALIYSALQRFRGEPVLTVVPMDCLKLVRQMYDWKARNIETHLCQVWGEFKPFEGVSIPSFLPETG